MYDFARFLQIRSAYGPAWAADGALLFLSDLGGSHQLWRLAAPGGWPACVYHQNGSNPVAAWLPGDGGLIVAHAATPANGDLYQVPLDGGAPRHLSPHSGEATYDYVNLAPDGGSLYLVSDQGR